MKTAINTPISQRWYETRKEYLSRLYKDEAPAFLVSRMSNFIMAAIFIMVLSVFIAFVFSLKP